MAGTPVVRAPGGLANNPLWPGWQVLMGVALVALIVTTVRRLGRVRRSMHGEENETPLPFPPLNGHTKK